MFDISFSELLVIAVVALIVIGPEKLPKVARTAGAFLGRMQRLIAQVKDEVNREGRFQELQKLQEEVSTSLQQEVNAIHQSIAAPELIEHFKRADAFTSDVPITLNADTAQTPSASDPQPALKKARQPRSKKPKPLVNASASLAQGAPLLEAKPVSARAKKSPSSRSTARTKLPVDAA